MSKFVKAFTYEPKIEAVKSGAIRQTIRVDSKVEIGDEILFHGWSGKPYRSKWSWRMRVKVNDSSFPVLIHSDGMTLPMEGTRGVFYEWKDLDWLADLDGIVSVDGLSTGESMGQLFNKMNKNLLVHGRNPSHIALVLRWDWPPMEVEA